MYVCMYVTILILLAPEILEEKPVTFSADLWSLGVVFFTL